MESFWTWLKIAMRMSLATHSPRRLPMRIRNMRIASETAAMPRMAAEMMTIPLTA